MLELTQASGPTKNMAYYLSESMLLHTRFGRYSASHLAAACLLTARVLLGLGKCMYCTGYDIFFYIFAFPSGRVSMATEGSGGNRADCDRPEEVLSGHL